MKFVFMALAIVLLSACDPDMGIRNDASYVASNEDCRDLDFGDLYSDEVNPAQEGCAEWVGIPEEHFHFYDLRTFRDEAANGDLLRYNSLQWYAVMRARFFGENYRTYGHLRLNEDMLTSPMAQAFGVIETESGVFYIPQLYPNLNPAEKVDPGIKAYPIKLLSDREKKKE